MRTDYSDMTLAIWEFMLLDSFGYLKPVSRQHLPFYSELGAYPIVYLTRQGNTLCADCATKALYLLDEESDPPIAYDVYYEGPDDYCDDCGKVIPSAYGDPDEGNQCEIRETSLGGGFVCAKCGDNCDCVVCLPEEEQEK